MNKWKIAFLVLAGGLLFAIVAIIYYATADVKQGELPEPLELEGNVLSIETTAKEFESIAKQYLSDAMNKSPLPVELVVEDKIYLYSTLTAFNVDIPIQMDFRPVVSKGNIILEQEAVHVGKFDIPPNTVLKLIKESVYCPTGITVRPNDKQIYVDLSRINIATGSRIRAKEIDLPNDKIVLEVVIPNNTD